MTWLDQFKLLKDQIKGRPIYEKLWKDQFKLLKEQIMGRPIREKILFWESSYFGMMK
jgi:hypothetical protein